MNFEDNINIKKEFLPINKEMLVCLDDLNKKLTEASIENRVVGGWAIEGLRGKLTREHHDVDYLIDINCKNKLIDTLSEEGFEIIGGWSDEDGIVNQYKHKIIGRKGEMDIDFVFMCIDYDRQEVNIKSFDKYKFPLDYLNGGEASVNLQGNIYNFNIVRPELLLSIKAGDERNKDNDYKYLLDLIGEEKSLQIINKYKFDYTEFRNETTK